MTGSASNAMDVFVSCDSLFIGEGFREGKALGFCLIRGWRIAPKTASQNCDFSWKNTRKTLILGVPKIIDFGEVFGEVFREVFLLFF